MAKQVTTDATDIFEQLRVRETQKETLDKVDSKRRVLEEDGRVSLDEYEQTTQRVLEGKADVEQLSKIDIGIQRGKQCTLEITQIAEGLATDFEGLGQFVGDLQNYHGPVETFLAKLGMTKLANKKRISRVRAADMKHNLETIVDFGHLMVHKVNDAIVANSVCYDRIGGIIETTVKELKDNQPIYEKWTGEREKLEREKKELLDKQSQATGQEYAKLEEERKELQKNLDNAQFNENHYFAKVDKAKQALRIQPLHQQAYRDNMDALNQIKQRLEADIEHNTPILLSLKTSIETALTTKSAGQYYKGLRMTLDVATDTVLKNSAGVMAEAADMAEKQTLDPAKEKLYREVQAAERASFNERLTVRKDAYAAPASGN